MSKRTFSLRVPEDFLPIPAGQLGRTSWGPMVSGLSEPRRCPGGGSPSCTERPSSTLTCLSLKTKVAWLYDWLGTKPQSWKNRGQGTPRADSCFCQWSTKLFICCLEPSRILKEEKTNICSFILIGSWHLKPHSGLVMGGIDSPNYEIRQTPLSKGSFRGKNSGEMEFRR